MESEIQWSWFLLFPAYRHLRRRRHDRLFSSFSQKWSALCCSSNPCWRRGHHGARRDHVFPRTTVVAENRRHCVCDRWFVFAAQIIPSSLCKNLDSDISHRMCVADNVASTGKEKVE